MFTRVAIVNRGEAAMRLINAVRELNAAGGDQIETVALHVDAESAAMFVREADAAYALGPASARPYLDHAVLERALRETGADAAWVGWGFVAEDPAFADLCDRLGVTLVGPSGEAMRRLGDKIGAKLLAEDAGVPVAPWSRGAVRDVEKAHALAWTIGYPLMLKATAGGGGRGIRVVTSDEELVDAFERTREEAARSFGSDVVFLERLVTGARHIEVQVIADGQGTAWALGVRDCTLQRRNQKVIEESASPVLDDEQVLRLKESAQRLLLSVGYCGAATVEFLYEPAGKTFSFLEVNTRLQVEHPITEVTTAYDLVKAQLRVAAGGRLEGDPPGETGHAVEARLNAEDPDRDFAPSPGRIVLLHLPSGPGIRVDTGVAQGDVIPADFDSMIAKVIACGPTRAEALARLRRALADTTVIIEGGATNKTFLLELLDQPEVVDGSADTGWIDRVRTEGRLASPRHAGVALVAAAVEAYEEQEAAERAYFLATAHGGRPQARHEVGRSVDLKIAGNGHRVAVAQTGARTFRVGFGASLDGRVLDVELERLTEHTSRLLVGNHSFRLVGAAHGSVYAVEVDGTSHRVTRDEGGVVRSPAPALVVAVPVELGTEVEAGKPVIVLESMKMETVLVAPFAARVRELMVATGDQVETGMPMVRLEPRADDDQDGPATAVGVAAPLDLPDPAETPSLADRAGRRLEDLRGMLLGFDVAAHDRRRSLDEYGGLRGELPADRRLGAELKVVRAFADLCELTRNKPAAEEPTDERVHSPREFFHAYLHSLDVDREHLPESFRDRLARVLTHYGVTELVRSPALEEAVYRIFLAQRRSQSDLVVITTLLQHWLGDAAPGEGVAPETRDALDRLVLATQLRYPVVGELARSVRFRWFDEPVVECVRAGVLAAAREEVAYLAAFPDGPDHAVRLDALAANPERIVRFLAERLEGGIPEREPMLEVLARRHYREYELHDMQVFTEQGRPFVTADYAIDDRPSRLITTVAQKPDLSGPGDPGGFAAAVDARLAATPPGHDSVIDLYLSWPEAPASVDDVADQLRSALDGLAFAQRVRRVAIGLCVTTDRPVTYFTFRPGPDGVVVEDDLVRGVHPMVGRRLNLWRLRNFQVTRLEAPEDVLLYLCIAPDNDDDQRLVALTQVRELTVVRDGDGQVTSLPQAERAVTNCLEAIRRARTARGPAGSRLDMNHVFLHIWPAIDAPLEELASLQRTIAPLTAGAGIDEVAAQGHIRTPDGRVREAAIRFSYRPGAGVVATLSDPPTDLLAPLDDYAQKVLRARRRGTTYPYELLAMIAGPRGSFTEHDLDDGVLAPVERPAGRNRSGLVAGVARTPTREHPEGITRVVLLGDPTKALGAVAEAECARVIAALDLADRLGVPVEWWALSAGARISMVSGTENMDWVAKALRRIVTFTQDGGEVNVVVAGINVGAQPYWNAEATMLMHTKGVLVMTPDSAMVLTGKQSLDFSGGVSAEDNFGIGGYDRVMGPNGQAQYWAPGLAGACDVLHAHYAHSYLVPGERSVRRAETADPVERDVSAFPHDVADSDFRTVGDIFSTVTNPDRKKAFDIRTVMRAVADQDHSVLERWAGMADAETTVVYDAHLGGWPVCMVGIESRPIPRRGFPPSDGPDIWTAGTLFPRSSKKTARAINAASANRPLVVLANLSGFDGSPDSMRNLQLEYGAEIGRAVINFVGPIVFCVVSRYHGGAFVVFSKALNPNMTVLAVEGSFASVIGGAPAAAVVFAGDVEARTAADPRVRELENRLTQEEGAARAPLATELGELRASVRSQQLGQVAAEFDHVHTIQRAVEVGSVDAVIAASELRPKLIAAVEHGMSRW